MGVETVYVPFLHDFVSCVFECVVFYVALGYVRKKIRAFVLILVALVSDRSFSVACKISLLRGCTFVRKTDRSVRSVRIPVAVPVHRDVFSLLQSHILTDSSNRL